MEKFYTVSKNKTGSWLWLRSWTPYCQIQTEIEEVGKTTRPFGSVQFGRFWLFVTPWIAAHPASLSITNSQNLLKLMSIESVMPSSHLILCSPLLLQLPIPPSLRVFSNESVLCIRWPKYWSFSFSINPSNEYSGLISSKIDWFDLLAVQGTLKSLLQHHSLKSINSSVLCPLYGPAFTTVCDYWEDHSLDYTDLCSQSDVFAF